MATLGGILAWISIYGLFIAGSISFFFQPNIITLLVFVFTMWLFLSKRSNNDKKE